MNHHMKNARRGDTRSFFWALLRLLTLCLLEILVKRFFFKILFPTFAISLKNGDSYSKKYSFEVFSQKMPPIFHFSWNPGDRRPIVNTSVEAACLCWPGVVHCCLFVLLFAFYFVCFLLCLLCIVYLHCVYLVYFFADHVLLTVACLCFFCYMVSSKKMLSELVDFALIVGACWNPFCRTVLVSKCAVNCNHNQC